MTTPLFDAACACLMADDVDEKLTLTRETERAWKAGELALQAGEAPKPVPVPGRPALPRLVQPRELPKRSATPAGIAALIHSLAHIEFNAVNLAWDAVYRYRDMPPAFYDDWVRVAAEEAYHFRLLRERLRELGRDYGDFDAHNGLWEMAVTTAHDVMVRMALVPRVLEARGLDVTPGIARRLRAVGEERTVAILEIILRDEVGHVEIGSRWFRHCCRARGLDSEVTFYDLLDRYMKGRVKGPLHHEARRRGGFTESELHYLDGLV